MHIAVFAPAFTFSLYESESSRKPQVRIASVVSGQCKKTKEQISTTTNNIMKRSFLIILLVFSTIVTNAQNFAPIGATWHYTISWTSISFETLESVSDTTINGI